MINMFWFSVILAGGSISSDAVVPPEFYSEIGPIDTSLNELGPVSAHMGTISISFKKTKLTDVSRVIGSGSIVQQGDGGDALSYLCYTLEGESKSERLWLKSSELGGGEYIDGLTIVTIKPATGTDKCPVIDLSAWPVALDNGVTIGMDQERIIRRLGEPSKRMGSLMAYSYHTVRVQDGVEYDVGGRLNLHTTGGKLDGFSVDHSETN